MKYVFIAVFLCLLLLIACFSGPQNPSEEVPAMTLLTATDLHYLAPELTDHGPYFQDLILSSDGKVSAYGEELTEAFLDEVLARAPAALILSGDLTFNGERLSHEALAQKLHRVADAGIPVLVMPGNHDLENAMASRFVGDSREPAESVTAAEFENIYENFGFRQALSRDTASLSYMYELTPTLRILMLDVNAVTAPGSVPQETLRWAEDQLQNASRKGIRVIAVSHQNLLAHSSLLSDGFVIENAEPLLALYEKYDVICNLSGHVHMQHTKESDGGLWELVTSSLAVFPNQYGFLTLDGISAAYETVSTDVSAWAVRSSSKNSDLTDFSAYARSFTWDTAFRQARSALGNHPLQESLSAFFADVNVAYFSGIVDAERWDAALYRHWLQSGTFFSAYLMSIAEEGTVDHNARTFSY